MNPDAATLALAQVDVDISQIAAGQSITAKWRGKPIFIRQRTPTEIEEGKGVSLSDLKDPIARNANLPADAPATDVNRAAEGQEQWLVMVGVCTHLGCVPLGQSGDYDGWYCPCHGSHYDTAGRVRKGRRPRTWRSRSVLVPHPPPSASAEARGTKNMSGPSSYVPNNGVMRWLDARLPLPRLLYDSFVAFPVPRNLSYAYTFGGILALFLGIQI